MKIFKGESHSDQEFNWIYISTEDLIIYYKLNPTSTIKHRWYPHRGSVIDKQYSILFEGSMFYRRGTIGTVKQTLIPGNKI